MEDENLKATELRLGLPGASEDPDPHPQRGFNRFTKIEISPDLNPDESRVLPKVQVIGWPPIRSNRKNCVQGIGGMYVKVSMDGAPYLRKIDLKVFGSYEDLREGLKDLFKCFTSGEGIGGLNHAVAYEDKDGDWMLVGDVPWRMFISSCKRLRIMRGSDAKGLSSNS